jgi:quercetin dioxygenase-like cupin family protein
MPRGVRRVVTGHDRLGKAVVTIDEVMTPQSIPTGAALFTKVWTTATSPADNDDLFDGSRRESGLTVPGGTVLRIVDIPVGARSPMHRANSLDYGIVLDGEMDMQLDSGEVVRLSAGDIVVQRGTIHAWINNSGKPTRMAFVLVDARPATAAGRILEPT